MEKGKRLVRLTALILVFLLLWAQVAWAAFGRVGTPEYSIYYPSNSELGNATIDNFNGYFYHTGYNQNVKVALDFTGWLTENYLQGAVIQEVYSDLSSIGMTDHFVLSNSSGNIFILEFPLPELNLEQQLISLPLWVQLEGEATPRPAGEYNLLLNYSFPGDWILSPDPRTQADMPLDQLSDFQITKPGVASMRWVPETSLSLLEPDLIANWADWQQVKLEPKLAGYEPNYLMTLPLRLEVVLENIYLADLTGDPDIIRMFPDGNGGWRKTESLDPTEFTLAPGWDETTKQVQFIANQPGIYAFPPRLQVSQPESDVLLTDRNSTTVAIYGQVQDLEAGIEVYLDEESSPRVAPGLNEYGEFVASVDLCDVAEGEHWLKIKANSSNPVLNEEIMKRVLVDYTPPEVTGVVNGMTYGISVTPIFNEGVGYLNGSPFISGTTIFSNGSYTLEVVDGVGHRTTVSFTISITDSGSGGEPNIPTGFSVPPELSADMTIQPITEVETVPGENAGVWEINYNGILEQPVDITFPVQTDVPEGYGAGVWYYNTNTGQWLPLGGELSTDNSSITATLTHFSRYGVFLRRATFTDLAASHWAAPAITRWAGQGRVQGYQGKFEPERTMTRAELASLLVRVLAVEDDGRSLPLPADVPANHWAARDIALVKSKGWLQGYNNCFRPQDPVTREELTVVLSRLTNLGTAADLSSYSDSREISPWARTAVGQAVQQGLLLGRKGNYLAATATATRAEAVTMLYRWNKKFGLNE